MSSLGDFIKSKRTELNMTMIALADKIGTSQSALSFGLLPAMLLSGLIYPISSMPVIFQYLTALLPPRYFITFIQTKEHLLKKYTIFASYLG